MQQLFVVLYYRVQRAYPVLITHENNEEQDWGDEPGIQHKDSPDVMPDFRIIRVRPMNANNANENGYHDWQVSNYDKVDQSAPEDKACKVPFNSLRCEIVWSSLVDADVDSKYEDSDSQDHENDACSSEFRDWSHSIVSKRGEAVIKWLCLMQMPKEAFRD